MKLFHVLVEQILSENLIIPLQEGAINDFNKLISRNTGFLFLLAGSPRSGKSNFVDKFITPKQRGLVITNPDDIALMFTGDPNIHKRGSTNMSVKRSQAMLKTRKDKLSFVYDSTGSDNTRLKTLADQAKQNGYKVIVINVIAPLKVALDRNKKAARHVSVDYLVPAWKTAQANIKKLHQSIKPDFQFVAASFDNKYVLYSYDGKKMNR
jgi:predicted kinase